MKKKAIAIGTLATLVLAGGYIGYVQIAPQTETTSQTEKIAQHISLNYKLNSFSLNTVAELLTNLYREDEGTKEFIYEKQTELAKLIREIEESDVPKKDSFLEDNKKNQIAHANQLKEVLSTSLAYYEYHSQENRDSLQKATVSLQDSTKNLLSIEDKVKKYNIKIVFSGKINEENDRVEESLSDITKVASEKVTISYKEGLNTHTIEVN